MTTSNMQTASVVTPALAPIKPVVVPWTLLVLAALNAGASVIDPLLTKGTLDLVNGDGTKILGLVEVSWLAAAGIFLASIAAPVKAGHEKAKGGGETAFMAFWGILGVALFLARWFEDVLISRYVKDFTEGGGWLTHLPMALLIAAVYVLTGLGFRSIAFSYYTSSWHLVHPAMKKADRATEKAIEAEGVVRHAEAALDTNVNQIALLVSEYESHRTRLRNAEAEIKDRVRIALAAHLGDPAEAGLAFESHKGTNALEAPISHR